MLDNNAQHAALALIAARRYYRRKDYGGAFPIAQAGRTLSPFKCDPEDRSMLDQTMNEWSMQDLLLLQLLASHMMRSGGQFDKSLRIWYARRSTMSAIRRTFDAGSERYRIAQTLHRRLIWPSTRRQALQEAVDLLML